MAVWVYFIECTFRLLEEGKNQKKTSVQIKTTTKSKKTDDPGESGLIGDDFLHLAVSRNKRRQKWRL